MGMSYNKRGLRTQFFNEMLKEFGDKCMICGNHVRHLVIDHDHETSLMRGLLCMKHNAGLGHFNHDPELLKKAANYLETHGFPDLTLEKKEPVIKRTITKRPFGLKPIIRNYGGYDKAELKVKVNELINDSSFRSDSSRAKELMRHFNISYSAAQSQITRFRHA